jgi:hypothetical protein
MPATGEAPTRANGPAVAAMLAAGIGCLVLGVLTTVAEASEPFRASLDFSRNYGLGSGVGPLSGKVTVAAVAYFLSWAVAAYVWRGRELNLGRWFTVTLVLIAAGLLLTFPPFFELFAPAE